MHNIPQRSLQYCKLPQQFRITRQGKYAFRLPLVLSSQIMEIEARQACEVFCYGSFGLNFKQHEDMMFDSLIWWTFVSDLNDELMYQKSTLNLNLK